MSIPPDDDRLLDLAVAIADRTPIDWVTAARDGAPPPTLVARLQRLERLVQGHEAVRSQISSPSAAAEDTLLTQARRKASGGADEGCRVQWGPLVVLDKIGRGSFGDVYRAWDPRLDREVALKLIPENASDSASSPVVEEGRLLARVRHPNVLTVHGAERIDGRVGIWTEYIQGDTLAQEIARRGPISAEEAARIGTEVCRALSAVHDAGLLHRDVKAQNILRDSAGRIVLSDFGTGIEFDEHAGITDPQIAGTPLYLAPEVFEHRPATIASDLYSVGVLLYFLVTGNYPVRGGSLAEIRQAHRSEARVPLRDARGDLPESFVGIVDRLLSADAGSRFQTAAALESALGHAWQRQAWLPVGISALVACVIAVAVFGVVYQLSSPPATPYLKAGDWILVATFDNRTGEDVLDGTIEAALKRELQFSEYVRVAQRDRWEDVLRLLGRPLDARLDRSLAREVCLRDGSIRALIAGRIEKTRSAYAVTFTIVNPENGDDLATFTDQAPGPSELLLAVRRQAFRVRSAFGETQAVVDNARSELAHIPIPSLDALSLHTKAMVMGSVRQEMLPPPLPVTEAFLRQQQERLRQQQERWAGVERLARKAVQEDAGFAHAWIMLAWALRNTGRPQGDYLPYARRALELADTATPQERYFIQGSFHNLKASKLPNTPAAEDPKELEQALVAYEALVALQPDDYYAVSNLQSVYRLLGRDRDLATLNVRLAEARPANYRLNLTAARGLVEQGNLAAARRFLARAEAALSSTSEDSIGWADLQFFRAYLDWFEEKPGEALEHARRLAAAFDRSGELRTTITTRLTFLYLVLGRLQEAENLAERARAWEGAAPHLLAYVYRERGDFDRLREYMAVKWPFGHPSVITRVGGRVEFLVPAGMLDEADREVRRYRETPHAALEYSNYPWFAGMMQLAHGHPGEAARLLQPALAIVNGWPPRYPNQLVTWTLVDALEANGDIPKAIETLENVVNHRPSPLLEPAAISPHYMWLESHARIARLYRKTGQEQKARAIEDRLRKLLAVADADHPLLKEFEARR